MSFIHLSLAFGGVAAAAIPVVLHLIMRQRPKYFEFPAIRFVRRRHDVNRRRLRLRHLLLLALRAAAVVLLGFALARPSVKFGGRWGSQDAPVAAALVFDTSMRMDYKHNNRTRLEEARQLALWLLAQLPEGSDIAVVDSRPGPSAFQVDRGAAKHRIEMLQTSAAVRSLSATLDEALRLAATSQLARKEIYVFTDLARAAWPPTMPPGMKERIQSLPDLSVYLVDVGVRRPVNTALGPLRLSQEVLANRTPLRIETEIVHTGPESQRTVELYIQDAGGSWQKRGERAVTLVPGQAQAVSFQPQAVSVGTHRGYVEIVGQDGLACDDRRYFTVAVKPPWQILIAAPDPPERHGHTLSQMLAPTGLARRGRARFQCDLVSVDKLTDVALDPYAAVCLVDPTPLEPAVWQKLANYTADGHGLAVFLGPGATRADSFNAEKAQEVLAGKLLHKLEAPDGVMYLRPENLDHPALAPFRGLQGTVPWEMLAVFRYWQLGSLAADAHVVLPYSTGRPAVIERPLGRGRAVTVTSPLSVHASVDPWNVLPYDDSGTALILVNGLLAYLVGSTDQKLNYYAGQTVVLPIEPGIEYRSYALSLVDSPEAVEVRLTPDLKRRALVVAATEMPGNYRVRAGGTATGVDWGFSVNLDPGQTALERIPEDELKEILAPLPFQLTRDREELDAGVSRGRVGRELFPLLAVLLAAALAAEHLVANRFYRA